MKGMYTEGSIADMHVDPAVQAQASPDARPVVAISEAGRSTHPGGSGKRSLRITAGAVTSRHGQASLLQREQSQEQKQKQQQEQQQEEEQEEEQEEQLERQQEEQPEEQQQQQQQQEEGQDQQQGRQAQEDTEDTEEQEEQPSKRAKFSAPDNNPHLTTRVRWPCASL